MLSAAAAGAALGSAGLVGGPAAAIETLGASREGRSGLLPRTLITSGRPGKKESPGFRVHHVGITWSGPALAGRLRVKRRGAWGPWRPVQATDSPGTSLRATLIYVGDATAYEFAPERGVEDVDIHAINTRDGERRIAAAPEGRWASSPYLPRAAWGADESLRFAADGTEVYPAEYFPAQALTVHHTVTVNSDPDPSATVRAVYAFQALPPQNFGDMGYHLLIDESGKVYEGRWSGDDLLPVFGDTLETGGELLMSNGAHVGGFNAGNVGVAFLGDFTSSVPTRLAHRSAVIVLAALCAATGLDPRGTSDYINPVSGDTATVPTIAGHRDWVATECPGTTLYPLLPNLRNEVSRVVGLSRAPRLR